MRANHPQPVIPRSFQFALFLTGCLWLLAAERAAARLAQVAANAANSNLIAAPLNQLLLLVFLLAGFTTLSWIATRSGNLRSTCALPKRPTSRQEFLRGAAVGWGLLLAVVLPLMLTGTLHPDFAFNARSWGVALTSLATLALGTLAVEIAFRGYLFSRLISAMGPVAATVLLSLAFAVTSSSSPSFTPVSVAANFLLGVLPVDGLSEDAWRLAGMGFALRLAGGDGDSVRPAGGRL